MLGFLVVFSLPPYAGYDYSGVAKDLSVRADIQGFVQGAIGQKDARHRLEQGSYMRRLRRTTCTQKCREVYDVAHCSICVRREVVREAQRSVFRCKGCPYCGGAPCFVWPCDSGFTFKPHTHTARGVWFPEEEDCPFLERRETPVLVDPERTKEIIENTCAPYERSPLYACVHQRNAGTTTTKTFRMERANSCRDLEHKGCVLHKRWCVREDAQKWCLEWEAHYVCEGQEEVVTPMPAFRCREGTGVKDPPSQDMGSALACLRGVHEGALNARVEGGTVRVFGGHALRCHTDVMRFRDCCKVMDGWGKHLGFGCSDEERNLARLRQEKRCVFVGERVSERLAGVSARWQKVFCCFPSALMRLLRVHAQKKLNVSWGSALDPECHGLPVRSLEGVDFSDVDARAVYNVLRSGEKNVDYSDLKQKVERAVARMGSDVR